MSVPITSSCGHLHIFFKCVVCCLVKPSKGTHCTAAGPSVTAVCARNADMLGLLDVQVLDDVPAGLCAETVLQVRRHSGGAVPMVHALCAMHVVCATRRVCLSLVVLPQTVVADQSG